MHVTILEVRTHHLQSSGLLGLAEKLQVDVKTGLTGHDFEKRTEQFGDN